MDILTDLANEPISTGHAVSDAAMRRLGIEIVTGKFQPGHRLLPEIESAEAYGISRTAYREAMRVLTAKGLLSSRQKLGTVVNPRSCWQMLDPDILAWSFQNSPSREFIYSLFELRLALEPMAASLAAQRRSAAQVKHLRECVSTLSEHAVGSTKGRATKRTFHMAVFEATQNEFLITLAEGIGAAAEWTTAVKTCFCRASSDSIKDHRRLVDAIDQRSTEVARGAATTLLLLGQEETVHALFGHI